MASRLAGTPRPERPRRGQPPPATAVLEPLLFDLPLESGAEPSEQASLLGGDGDTRAGDGEDERPAAPSPRARRTSRNFGAEIDGPSAPARRSPARALAAEPLLPLVPAAADAADVVRGPAPARLAVRLRAGALDLLVHLAVLSATVAGLLGMGVPASLRAVAPLALFGFVFSFLYTVVPLAFWGHTPGMAWAGLRAADRDGGPLPFGGTVRRWLGGVLTVAAAGLPVLLALRGGGSLADRLSSSQTYAEPESGTSPLDAAVERRAW